MLLSLQLLPVIFEKVNEIFHSPLDKKIRYEAENSDQEGRWVFAQVQACA